jgi:hypothetical protein
LTWQTSLCTSTTGQDVVWEEWEPLGDNIVCDGTRHIVVKRFRTHTHGWHSPEEMMDPTLPVVVNTKIMTNGPAGAVPAHGMRRPPGPTREDDGPASLRPGAPLASVSEGKTTRPVAFPRSPLIEKR